MKIVEVAMEMALPQSVLEEIARRFGPEKARDAAMSTSVGGIGPLLRERIFGQAEAGLDLMGVSLLYESVWVQAWHEWGQLNLQKRNIGKELRQVMAPRADLGFDLTFFDGKTARVEVWELAYGPAKVYFLSSPEITDVVYPGPKDMPHPPVNPYAWAHEFRLKQSWLVGRGALMLSKKLNRAPNITVLSETPTIFAHHRLVRDEFQSDEFFSGTKYVFNDHTPLEYAHPVWDLHTLQMVKIDSDLNLNTPAWNQSRKTLDVTSLLAGTCEGVFGVAKKHAEVMRAMASLRVYADKIQYITNGVRLADWQAPEFSSHATMSDNDLVEAKQKRKKILLDWAWRRCRRWPLWAKEALDKKLVLWTRRITPYKRLDILLKLLRVPEWRERFVKLNTIIFIGGRIHQQDTHAQDIVYDLLDLLDKDKILGERIVFVDNFNVWEAPTLFQGADASIMMADDTREASATGFMKAQMNGAAIIATLDGAIPEFVRFHEPGAPPPGPDSGVNGFLVPYANGEPTSEGLLQALEAFDLAYRNEKQRLAMMRANLAVTLHVDVGRTARQMKELYDKLLTPSLHHSLPTSS